MRALRFLLALLAFAVAASASTYTVRWGDTLGGVARRLGVPLSALVAANGIADPDRIRAGQVLTFPPAGGSPAAPAVHRVAWGETLGAIARRYGTTVAALVRDNRIADPHRIRAGALLRVEGVVAAVCPVQGKVRFISGFGAPRDEGRRHEGVDLAAARGTPVVANVSGFLKRTSGPRGGHAYYLEGDDGVVYYGAHLSAYVGADRRWLRLGEPIGRVGSSGNAEGTVPHLHFERMPAGGAPVDPYPLLARVCPTR